MEDRIMALTIELEEIDCRWSGYSLRSEEILWEIGELIRGNRVVEEEYLRRERSAK